MPIRRILAALACTAAMALAACAGKDDYPADWPPVVTDLFKSCPDLSGTYDVAGGLLQGLPVNPPKGGPRWERLVVEGPSARGLRLTLQRIVRPEPEPWSPQRERERRLEGEPAGDAAVKPPPPPVPPVSETLLAPGAYTCSHGRLWVGADVMLARDRAHGLVADASQKVVTRQIDLWCGDHCVGIPTGFGRLHHWARWDRLPY